MIVRPQQVLITCISTNKEYLMGKGYNWQWQEKILIDVDDLKKRSNISIKVLCDICLEIGRHTIFTQTLDQVHKFRKNIELDCCSNKECKNIKRERTVMLKYGVTHSSKIPESRVKISDTQRLSYDFVKKAFESRGYKLISPEYNRSNENLLYICLQHPEKGIQDITYGNLSQGSGCYYCSLEYKSIAFSGQNSPNWRGGVSNSLRFFRRCLKEWKKQSMKSSNYKCVLSGDNSFVIHHLHPYSELLESVFDDLGLPRHEDISIYSIEEITQIENLLLQKHLELPLGVCVSEDLHKEFHKLYGKHNNTPEQFFEYAKVYHDIDLFPKYYAEKGA